jgi:very-short-patch-repair endonuclease
LGGLRFRRQYPIGRYVVDFVCLDGRLVIELDGGQHAEAIEKDERRSAELRALGFTVVRFWDNDVLERTEQVVETIRMTLGREGITAGRR